MGRANAALDDGCDRAARLLDLRDEGVRLVECVCQDLQELGAPPDVRWRLWRALHLLTLSSHELQKQRKQNKQLEKS